jgi:spermidine/putrescine transport system substrate-binding protein
MSIAKKTLQNGFLFIFLWTISFSFAGCFKKESATSQTVNLAIWGNYIEPKLLEQFSKDTGIKVNVSNYASNEELLAKVQAGSSGIDVAVPSDYMVSIMTKLDLLHEIDSTKIANRSGISPELLGQSFDPQNKYSLPYAWSTTGIAINRELFKGTIKSWKDVFENPELKGKLSLLDDVREVMAAALKMNGNSVNATKEDELQKAKSILSQVKPRVKMFRSDTVEALLKKEVAVAQSYSTDALQAARKSNGQIEYILPEEGGARAIDTVVILKTAQNVEGAHKLINYMLSSDVNVSFVTNVMGGPVLKATKEKLSVDLQNNASLFPTGNTLSKFEGITDVGTATKLYDDIWTLFKTE